LAEYLAFGTSKKKSPEIAQISGLYFPRYKNGHFEARSLFA